MKRKIGLALAVILVGVFVVVYAQAKGEKVEPTSTPVSSSVSASSAPVATEEPAETPEPLPSDAVIIEDSALPQPVDQEVDEGYSNEGAEPVEETDESYDAMMDAWFEERTQYYMDKFGISREEAESMIQQVKDQSAANQAQMEQNRQEASEQLKAEEDAKVDAFLAEQEAYFQERYGLSTEEWDALSAIEQAEMAATHPWNG